MDAGDLRMTERRNFAVAPFGDCYDYFESAQLLISTVTRPSLLC